jgi:tetratricopeptide (TPR) repeat protein
VGGEVGGYFITVTAADEDEEPTEALESRTFTPSGFGRLALYESRRQGFAFKYPGDWGSPEECPEGVTACFQSDAAGLYVLEEDLDRLPIDLPETDLDSYVDLIEELLLSNLQGAEILAREPLSTPHGLAGTKLVISAQAGLLVASRFIYVSEDDIAFNISYFTSAQAYEILEEFFDYSYKTFRDWDEDNLENDPVYHLDEGTRLAGEQEYEAAIDAFSQAITLNPALVEAYIGRESVYESIGEYALALADVEAAIALEPEEAGYVGQKALVYWAMGELENALDFAGQAIELDPEDAGFYNNRALMRASAGDYEGALADMERLVELEEVESDDELSPGYLDSRAYVYLKLGEYEEAKRDYDLALNQDFKSPYPLLGAAIANAELGLMEEAMAHFEYGLELYEESAIEYPSPQLADLLEMAAEYFEVD